MQHISCDLKFENLTHTICEYLIPSALIKVMRHSAYMDCMYYNSATANATIHIFVTLLTSNESCLQVIATSHV